MIPGWLISIATFPGIIVHEFGHKFFCDQFEVKVLKTCYFRLGNPAGYVLHEETKNFKQAFFIDIGPFIVNNLFAIIAFVFAVNSSEPNLFFIWLGGSFAINSFPSTGDAKALWANTKKYSKKNLLLIAIGYPFVIIIYLANILSIIWFDLIWAFILYGFVASIF